MLNSHFDDSELPFFGSRRLQWLEEALAESDQPTLIAIHHPPMKTGIGFIDMVGPEWYQGLGECSPPSPGLKIICGHGHLDIMAASGNDPGSDGGSIAHQLIAGRVMDLAPSFDPMPGSAGAAPLDGWRPWSAATTPGRTAWMPSASTAPPNMDWEDLKDRMRGSMK